MPRVVVTGIGAVTPIGTAAAGLYAGMRRAQSAVARITRFDPSPFRCQVAAEVGDFDPLAYMDAKRVKRLDRFAQFAVAAARQAVGDAGLHLEDEDRDRCGCFMGGALGGGAFAEEQHEIFLREGIKKVRPTLALAVFSGSASCNIAIEFGLTGPTSANSDSCSSGAIAIGEAFRLIKTEQADLMLAGGAECPLSPLIFGAFDVIRAMSTRNQEPERACRHLHNDADGLLCAPGAIEAAISLLALRHDYLPPTVNLDAPDPECDLDYIPHEGREAHVDHILSNSFGFGGINASLVLGRYDQ